MCGIVAVLPAHPARSAPDPAAVLDAAAAARRAVAAADMGAGPGSVAEAAEAMVALDGLLRGPGGVAALTDPDLAAEVRSVAGAATDRQPGLEAGAEAAEAAGASLEECNRALVAYADAAWALFRDRLDAVDGVLALAPTGTRPAVAGLWAVHGALRGIDRLEVRGRDSAGLAITVAGHGVPEGTVPGDRLDDPRFVTGAVRVDGDALVFVYKAAAEIGELGDNTARIAAAVRADDLLHRALAGRDARVTVVAHTRWASVGIISEPNAHPLDQRELGRDGPVVVGVLNGDVDNHADLKADHHLRPHADVTTDAKVIPTLTSRRIASGAEPVEAFRATVSSFVGSVAVAAVQAAEPDQLLLALRGSGQGLFVGVSDDAYVVASEPYGVVEEAGRYLRLDGDERHDPADPASRGQVVVLHRAGVGGVGGLTRLAYDGTELPVSDDELMVPEMTTRDIDRGEHPHYLLKEIGEAPTSFRRTLRGRLVERDGELSVDLGEQGLPAAVRDRLSSGAIRRIDVIGQGTAAVAGTAVARAIRTRLGPHGADVRALPATELSGFELRPDMSDTLVVAISQSGTTTDTNRTVDVSRDRGASVLAIVNRRGSDLAERADGVIYTSDGRDIEMSVASTKAFYAQVAAGFLLAEAAGAAVGVAPTAADRARLAGLRRLPDAMTAVLGRRDEIAAIASRHAPAHRYWAIVGNGPNRVAAEEIRIKLSELCYKSIACDATEDKKHIDLSSEPLVLVCAVGLEGSNADDVAKEVAIFRAHSAVPIVVATEGESRFSAATELVEVPAVHPDLDFVLAAMVGHLFGYEAARAIDRSALPLRRLRSAIERVISSADDGDLLDRLRPDVDATTTAFLDGLRTHLYDGHLEASTALRLSVLLRYASGLLPLDLYQVDVGRVGTPSAVVEDLLAALTAAIDELTRPIDAIKHQAKTVTVGISRSDEALLRAPLVAAVLGAGAPRDRLTYDALRALAGLDPAVDEVTGWTRYRIEGDPRQEALLSVVDRGGLGRDIRSRTEDDPRLRGTKRRVAEEREVWVARGRSDGRTVIHVPEVKGSQVTGLTLLHVRFVDRLEPAAMRGVLNSYRDRYAAIRDAVTETEPTFRDDVLGRLPVVDILTQPVYVLAEEWAS